MGTHSKKRLSPLSPEANQATAGQVLVEYILMVGFAVGLLTVLQSSLRGTIYNVWITFAKEISAGCPTPAPGNCLPDPNIK